MSTHVGWFVLVVYVIYFVIAGLYLISPPASNPLSFLKHKEITCPGRKRIVVIGDSITHGHASQDYVKILKQRLRKAGKIMDVINAGINSQLAWNIVQKIDQVVECNPDFVTILIGTNDANSTLDPINLRNYMMQWKLPQVPDEAWYKQNLEEIVSTLKDLTNAKIAILSLPAIGENPDDAAFKVGQRYSLIAKDVATRAGIAYLPLCEAMVARIKENPSKMMYKVQLQGLMQAGQLLLHYHGIPYSWISKLFKLKFHVDYLHLNRVGASMVVDLIEGFIHGNAPVHEQVKPRKLKYKGLLAQELPDSLRLDATTVLVPKYIDQEGLKIGFIMGMVTRDDFKALCHIDEAMTLDAFAGKIGWDREKAESVARHLLRQKLLGIS